MCFTLCNMKPCVRLSVPEKWSKNGNLIKTHIKKQALTWSSKSPFFWLGGGVSLKRSIHYFGCTSVFAIFTQHRGIWIIYLATIQLGTSLIFTFYHQGHWMNLHSNLTYDTSSSSSSVRVPLPKCSQAGKCFMSLRCSLIRYKKIKKKADGWTRIVVIKHP